jgi:PTS system mannose-specific IID component
MTDTSPVMGAPVRSVPMLTRADVFLRLFAIQGSWNYELLMGTGIGFCTEPVLRLLPGGKDGAAYHAALARESRYFNAHPYLASLAVGSLARAELDEVPGPQIERFRTALCGPLGSVGDRLVWAGWLPVCSLLALALFGLGAGPATVCAAFLIAYNAGHVGLRAWGVRAGYAAGLRLAGVLATPFFRQGPDYVARAGALLAGVALPVALARVIGPGAREPQIVGAILIATAVGSIALARLQGRAEGWRMALVVVTAFVIYAVTRHG